MALILADMTARAAAATPDRIALVAGDTQVSYAALHDDVLRCVSALSAMGLGKGDRVGHLGRNSIAYVVLLQASLRLGLVTVPINWRLAAPEISYILADAGTRLLLADAEFLSTIDVTSLPEQILLTDAAHGNRHRFLDWVRMHDPDPRTVSTCTGDVALQLYTSGTTGRPKGALLTHGGLSASLGQGAALNEDWAAWHGDDVALVAMPQFHIGGTAWTMQTLNAGATAVLLARAEIIDIIDAVTRHRVTKMFAVPAVLAMILAHPASRSADFGSLRALLYGASPIGLDILKRAMALFPNASFVQMYGSTETGGTIVYLPPEDHDAAGTGRMAGCGKPYPSVKLRIVSVDDTPLPPGEIGEILIRSPTTMAGYHQLPQATATTFVDGWLRSGDAGYLDADGYLYLVDRIKDMIVSGAENIYPAEVEAALRGHPDVHDCAVIAVPDPIWGEAVKAVVVAKSGVDPDRAAILAYARTKIAGYKVPKSIDFTPELPRNAAGKVLKRELRRRYWPEGGRQVG